MEAVPYTIFRLGPSYFTERYPIDDTCISKEILNDNGVGSSSNLVVISFLFRRFSSSSFLIL